MSRRAPPRAALRKFLFFHARRPPRGTGRQPRAQRVQRAGRVLALLECNNRREHRAQCIKRN
jgi:hypothetical protein